MAKIIAFCNLKGGTGKSNVLFNLCGVLSQQQKKVLVIDFDPQGDTSTNLGKNRRHSEDTSVVNMFFEKKRAEELIETTNIRHVSLIKGSVRMTAIEAELVGEEEREFYLKKYIQQNAITFDKFDYIFVDTNPTFSITNQNVYFASDHIYLISDTSINSVEKAEDLAEMWDALSKKHGLDNNIGAFIVNRYKKTRLSKQFLEYVQDHPILSYFFIQQVIPDSVKFAEAEVEQRPVFKGRYYKEYEKLVKELKNKGVL